LNKDKKKDKLSSDEKKHKEKKNLFGIACDIDNMKTTIDKR
jgi:hypothetical protein